MTDRRYSEDEVAKILEAATEVQEAGDRSLPPGDGVTLAGLRDIGREGDGQQNKVDLDAQIAETKRVLRIPKLWAITLVAGLRGMAFVSFLTFLPLYLTDELSMNAQFRGIHIALLFLVGIVFTPITGYLSDRIG